MKTLITGGKGMLGKDIVALLLHAGWGVIVTDREDLDITKEEDVMAFVAKYQPQVIINCAASNFVDDIEQDAVFEKAFAINAYGPRNLARAAKSVGATFVHYSTDYVFPGEKTEGYIEFDQTRPISRYGLTKEMGEKFVAGEGGQYYICRLSKIFGEPGLTDGSKESFVALMLRLAKEKPELNVVHEEVGCPSFTKDIAEKTVELLYGPYEPGIYHLVNEGPGVTWYEFAKEIFDIAGVITPVNPVPSSAYPKPASRPKFAALRNTKLPPMRPRLDALREFLTIK